MPRRSLLSQAERELLFAFPTDDSEMNQYYTFSEHDLSFIRQHRTPQNKLGFAVQICYLRYPGYALPPDGEPPYPLLQMIAKQINLDSSAWPLYSTRPETRREHLLELQTAFGYRPFSGEDYKAYLRVLVDLALQTDKGIFLATSLFQELRKQKIIIPPIDVIEKLCAEALSQGTNQIYTVLTESLTDIQRQRLDELLDLKPETRISHLTWLKQPPNAPNAKHILEHIDRLKLIKSFVLDDELQRQVHQNRLLKIAREGEQMTAQHLRDLGTVRRYATLVAILLESQSTLIDEIVDIHDRIIGTLFNRAKHNHAEKFQSSGRSINEKVRLYWRIGQALLDAKSKGTNPFEALEAIIPWEDFTKSVEEAHKLSQDEDFDYLYLIGNSYSQVRRYAPSFLDALVFKATPSAQELLNGVEIIKKLNDADTRSVPKDAPTGFIR